MVTAYLNAFQFCSTEFSHGLDAKNFIIYYLLLPNNRVAKIFLVCLHYEISFFGIFHRFTNTIATKKTLSSLVKFEKCGKNKHDVFFLEKYPTHKKNQLRATTEPVFTVGSSETRLHIDSARPDFI